MDQLKKERGGRSSLCGHTRMRIHDYGADYRWVVRCEVCGITEAWTQREWRRALLLDESAEQPPLLCSPDSSRLVAV
ncbi:MAG: hypothetical protein AB7N76_24675 [Planctomycetota bacterium]